MLWPSFEPADVQFGDALVSSAVVWFRNEQPSADYQVRMTYGGSLTKPRVERSVAATEMRDSRKWTRFPRSSSRNNVGVPTLNNFFRIKRGLATGDNKFFILEEEEINRRQLPRNLFRPILPSPRSLGSDEVQGDDRGNPLLKNKLFLLDCGLPSEQVRNDYPTLWTYF